MKRKVGKGQVELDDMGVLIDAIVYNRKEYEKIIAGKLIKWGGHREHLIILWNVYHRRTALTGFLSGRLVRDKFNPNSCRTTNKGNGT